VSPEKKAKKGPQVNPKVDENSPKEDCITETTSSESRLSTESSSVDGDKPDPLWLEDDAEVIAEVTARGEQRPFGEKKPRGSACVAAKLRIKDSDISGEADICVNTGADVTVCTTKFVESILGPEALQWVDQTGRLPRLWSASGHPLKVIGRIKLKLP